jgi:hypothetical protein
VREGAREAGRDPDAVRIVVRGVVDLLDDPGRQRRPFQGTREHVVDDLAALSAQGVTEVFFDLNFSPRLGFPDIAAGEALAYASMFLTRSRPLRRWPVWLNHCRRRTNWTLGASRQ